MDLFLLLNSLVVSLGVIGFIGLKYALKLNAHMLTSALFVFFVVCVIISQIVQNSFFSLVLISFLIPSFVMLFYSLHRSHTIRLKILLTVYTIFISLLVILNSNVLLIIVFGFELIVFLTLYLLIITIKTDRGLTALLELFIWAIIGSLLLLTGIAMYTSYSIDGSDLL